ncbi:hypothetical protein [Pseudoclavibacter sp. VKM Ac-2888]|uniref:hypothetical protein n=1 Tax=Pseudoclavibacter sp. VKM Ac-2888 TaxID=2783830 RepID=UPI00188C49BE|nr:hypothetical protein [Pseudoclavibacter sp. VKM Ac-2888]MBF4549334.1 hypothetical protein [Pseudoclavibacter sp. VKM Ac-2888]
MALASTLLVLAGGTAPSTFAGASLPPLMGVGLVGGWNNLISLSGGVGQGLLTFATVFGVGLIVWVIVSWLWKRRSGGAGGFPVMGLLAGLFFAALQILVPLVLAIVQGLLTLISSGLSWFAANMGG